MFTSDQQQEKIYLDLFSFSQSVFAAIDVEQLLPEILQWVAARTHAGRCRIILYDGQTEAINLGNDFDPKVSSTIVELVKAQNAVFVSANAMEDARLQESLKKPGTIMQQKLLSVACAPIRADRQVFGIVYIDHRDEKAVFDADTGRLLQGLADLMAAALKKSLDNSLQRRQETARLHNELRELRREVDQLKGFGEMIGTSPAIQKVYQDIHQKTIYNTANVLVTGESGTGKELVARTIHKKGPRSREPFVVIDCSTLNAHTIESELFGHEKGAFTDAREKKLGLIEVANGGTLLIDEIGNLGVDIQQKLLRVLDSRELYRVGGVKPIAVDARFVFATNENLPAALALGKFRQDLYYRIAEGIHIHLPPLRERGRDIVLIAEKLLQEFSEKNKKRVAQLDPQTQEILLRQTYPGNVRELRRLMLNAVLDAPGDTVSPQDLLPYLRGAPVPLNAAESPRALDLNQGHALLYNGYLPETYRATNFIRGFGAENQEFAGKEEKTILQEIRRELHDTLVVSVKEAIDLPLNIATAAAADAFERNLLIAKLIQSNGRVLDTAARCQVDKKTLISKAKKHGLKKEWYVK